MSRLTLRHFRNLGVQRLSFPPEGVAVIGGNAQGKTNLLEAIYYLEIFRSFRGARDEHLVAFGEEGFRVSAELAPGDGDGEGEAVEVAAGYDLRSRRKKVTVDGTEAGRLGEAVGRLGAVVFSPDDVAIVAGGPAARRRFLDVVLSLNEPGYLPALQRYRQILAQRNAALRDGAPGASVRAWDGGLARAGAAVVEARRRWVERWGEAFRGYYEAVAGGGSAGMEYRPGFDLDGARGAEEVAEALADALARSGERERRLGATVVGPHRDDLRLWVRGEEGDVDLRAFGSGGERRTAVLALRLVEAATVREARGREPIVLLDDVFGELDRGRGERVLGVMGREETGQLIVTAPKEEDLRVRVRPLPRWRIRGGVVEEC